MVRNLFRKWLAEWVTNSVNNGSGGDDRFAISMSTSSSQIEHTTIDQTLKIDKEQLKMMRKISSTIFGDVANEELRQLGSILNHEKKVEEKPSMKSTLLNMFNNIITGFSKQNNAGKENEQSKEEKVLGNIKISMFGSEISPLYYYMTTTGSATKMNHWLVGTELSKINYHFLNSSTCYPYLLFANAGSDKFIGATRGYFKGSYFVVLLFDSEDSLNYLSHYAPMMSENMELIFVQIKNQSSNSQQLPVVVQREVVEEFIYSTFEEGVFLEVDVQKMKFTSYSILMYATLLSEVVMGLNLRERSKVI